MALHDLINEIKIFIPTLICPQFKKIFYINVSVYLKNIFAIFGKAYKLDS